MRIEKINDMQIKVLLDEDDLAQHDIKLSDLSYGSEKTRMLFHYMMEQAEEQLGFESENIPLIVEAAPMDLNGLTIVITKIQNAQRLEEAFAQLPFAKMSRRFKVREAFDADSKTEKEKKQNALIYAFANLDDMAQACARANPYFSGVSMAYKYDGKYLLVLENVHKEETGEADGATNFETVEAIFSEYGNRCAANHLSKYYLQGHGEAILKENAMEVLSVL